MATGLPDGSTESKLAQFDCMVIVDLLVSEVRLFTPVKSTVGSREIKRYKP